MWACYTCTLEVEAGESNVQGHLWLCDNLRPAWATKTPGLKKKKLSVFLESLRPQVQDHSSPRSSGRTFKDQEMLSLFAPPSFPKSASSVQHHTAVSVRVPDAERERHIQIWVFVYRALTNQILNPPNMTEKLMKREIHLKEPIRKSPTTLLLLTEQ